MNQNVDTGGNLAADSRERKRKCHEDHGLKTREHVIGAVGMNGAERPVMSCIRILTTIIPRFF